MIRIGQGIDVHSFGDVAEEGVTTFITLAGVKIEHPRTLLAHSDGDVVLHALADALLGSVALGDIGHHFPDTDESNSGLDSRVLLRHVYGLITQKGLKLVNADITVMCERPKLAIHNLAMRRNIAEDLQVDRDVISIKATTTEKLGFTGREEGIMVSAVVLISDD